MVDFNFSQGYGDPYNIGDLISSSQPITQEQTYPPVETPTAQPAAAEDYNSVVSGYQSQFPELKKQYESETQATSETPDVTPQAAPAAAPSTNVFEQQRQLTPREQFFKKSYEDATGDKGLSWWEKLVNPTGAGIARAQRQQTYYTNQQTQEQGGEAHMLAQAKGQQDMLMGWAKLPPGSSARATAVDAYIRYEKQQGIQVPPELVKTWKNGSEDELLAAKMALGSGMQQYMQQWSTLNPIPTDPAKRQEWDQAHQQAQQNYAKLLASNPQLLQQHLLDTQAWLDKVQAYNLNQVKLTAAQQYLQGGGIGGGTGTQQPQSQQASGTPGAPAPTAQPPATPHNQRMTQTAEKAQHYGVDPRIVMGVLGTERSNDNSISPAGAVGRYQIMPETARPYLAKMDPLFKDATKEQIQQALLHPETNEHVGLSILSDLQTKFGGNAMAVFGGYHSGPGNVNPDGTLKRQTRDVNMSTSDYQKHAWSLYNGQNPPLMSVGAQATPGATPQAQATPQSQTRSKLDQVETQIAETKSRLPLATVAGFGKIEEDKLAQLNKDRDALLRQLDLKQSDFSQVAASHGWDAANLTADQSKTILDELQSRKVDVSKTQGQAAIDRAPVPKETLTDINNYRREKGLPELPQGINQGQLNALPESERQARKSFFTAPTDVQKSVIGAGDALDDMSYILGRASELHTGPIAGRWEEIKNHFGIQGNTTQAVLDAVLARLNNKSIHEFAGSAQGSGEIRNIMAQLANLKDQPEAFFAKLNEAYGNLHSDQKRRTDALKQEGFSVPKSMQHEKVEFKAPTTTKPTAPTGAGKTAAQEIKDEEERRRNQQK